MPLPEVVSELQPVRNRCLELKPEDRYSVVHGDLLSTALEATTYEEAVPSEELATFLASLEEYNEQCIQDGNSPRSLDVAGGSSKK
mmetsp:Transcript_19904/g.75216  ORF Transcript_19904/g.75216 Transcript_19904/m.75216 type:complete len:86 (-) Transcript_19904:50-307(-)|eukprot:scaffold2577_cov254-Pinguiococcus_pyrenoidosus.AAC.1